MIRSCNYLIWMAAAVAVWGRSGHADTPPPPADAPPPPAGAAQPAPPDATSPPAPAPVAEPAGPAATASAPPAATTDASTTAAPGDLPPDLVGEAIEVFAERPDKPFDRDTELRLTGEQLAARGAVDLATALALLPDVSVRDAGRGGFNIDVRGARKGAVSVLIDGVLVSDPYYGTFDVSTIPVTDIVQIRVATTPQSPIDGPGGPGGVIEVHTRDAIGPQLVMARLTADSLPSLGATGTARVALARHLSLRLSASGLGGARDLTLPGDAAIGEERHAATGAGRLEYRKGDRRIAIDGFLDDRHYVAPPSDVTRSTILMIDRETSARASIQLDDKLGPVQIQGRAWTHYLSRRSRSFMDPALTVEQQVENLAALRSGASALATMAVWRDFRWAASATVDFEKAVVSNILNQAVRGKVTIVEPAVDLQYERGPVRGDLALGVALPFGVGASPWPELKTSLKVRLPASVELTATAAYKGRLPSLRERFDAQFGNPDLAPERVAHGELRGVVRLADRLQLELAPYAKRSTGTVRVDPLAPGPLVNLGKVWFWGIDTSVRASLHPMLDAGASYSFVRARALEPNASGAMTTIDDPIDRLPRHRADGWVLGRPLPGVSAMARVRYLGRAIDQTKVVSGYALLEATVSAQITPQYLAVLRVDDVLDVQPETRVGYHTAGRVVSLVVQGAWE